MVTETYKNGILKFNARVRIQAYDWDRERIQQLRSGVGFKITQKGKTDKDLKPGMYSIHSPLYGTDWGDDHAFEDRYSCQCGNLIGKSFLGKTCPACKTKVEFVDIDLRKTGWIVLEKDKIIQPLFYEIIENFIGGSHTKSSVPLSSILTYVEPSKIKPEDSEKNPFFGIGIIEFQSRFKEIMDYFLKINKKIAVYQYIMINSDIIFTSSIPVFSSYLRPFIISGEDIKYTDEDKLFRQIYTNSTLLNDKYVLERRVDSAVKRNKDIFYLRRESILFDIQSKLVKLWELVFNTINKKTGWIRSHITGGRMNFTARNVIVPGPNLKADEISIGYTTFLELYKLEIIALLRKIYKLSDPVAWHICEFATHSFDERIYKLMCYLVDNTQPYILLNRNPTIDYGSQLIMRITSVSSDITDNTLKLPINVLKVFNADFDGDILNIRCQKINDIKKIYIEQLSPRYNLFISRNDGLFNGAANIYRDQVVGLYNFANIDTDGDTNMDYTDILIDDSLLKVKI